MYLASTMGGPSTGVGGGEAPGVHSTILKTLLVHGPTTIRRLCFFRPLEIVREVTHAHCHVELCNMLHYDLCRYPPAR